MNGCRSAPGPKPWLRLQLADSPLNCAAARCLARFQKLTRVKLHRNLVLNLKHLNILLRCLQIQAGALAIPGGAALGQSNGLAVAEAVLALNALADNFGKPGGVFISALAPNQTEYQRPASAKEMQEFVQKMADGKFKVLFVHGVNPVFELPASLDFQECLEDVEQVISFATFPDETAVEADYIFPDHHGLESWGYQRVATGSAQSVLSGVAAVVSGVYKPDSMNCCTIPAQQQMY